MIQERAFWLAWSQISGVGPILIKRLHQQFGTLAEAWEANPEALVQVEGVGFSTAQAIAAERLKCQPDRLLAQHERKNPHFWTPADPSYPPLLLEIPDPPPLLYYRGKASLAKDLKSLPAIAIVGTRDPSDYGRRWTRKLSSSLAQSGFIVVSGLADGIDTEAHRSCLETGGQTIAVLGTGVDVVYPHTNRNLYQELTENGLALSEYPAGTQPDRTHFPRRNRIVAGLCRAVLVIEAPKKSGALITAHLANDYNRDVYALPGSLDNFKSKGCLALISKGAQMILGESELLEMLGTLPQLDRTADFEQLPLLDLSPELSQVLQSVAIVTRSKSESISFDLIVQQTEMTAGSVSAALLQLEMLGLVSQLPGLRYRAI
ncbi:MAG: DNA-protecting protein DprA [Leptolyngbyaceae cyanobacterium CSU_1_3]|nr:DNA-protecting protein DprA [Leptolyngbyaceae cyanobacterium CSU_1_3]